MVTNSLHVLAGQFLKKMVRHLSLSTQGMISTLMYDTATYETLNQVDLCHHSNFVVTKGLFSCSHQGALHPS